MSDGSTVPHKRNGDTRGRRALFRCFSCDGSIAGTINRRRHNERNAKQWTVATTDGVVVHSSDMVTACLSVLAIRLVANEEKAAAKAEADRLAAAKAAAANEPSMDELAKRLLALSGDAQLELYEASIDYNDHKKNRELDAAIQRRTMATFDVHGPHGLHEAGAEAARVTEIVGWGDWRDTLDVDGYANDYCDVFPICIVPAGVALPTVGAEHIAANQPK